MWKRFAALLFLAALWSLWPGAETAMAEDSLQESSDFEERLNEAKKTLRHKEAGKYGMVPVYPCDIEEGTYGIGVESSSPFFKITDAELVVAGGEMSAAITIPSLSYQYVYPGTAEQAEYAAEDDWIGCEEDNGHSIFTIPVEALDKEIDCAAFSKKRQMWYDRKLVFDASTLPQEALKIELPDYELIELAIRSLELDGDAEDPEDESAGAAQDAPEPVSVAREDGEYSIEVNMTGGSGRASISSPTLLTVRDGKAYAKLLWSSAYYDYMIVEGERYYNLTEDGGNSTFEIPITVMDDVMPVIADTTAMGEPVEIAYNLTFYPETIGAKGLIPQEAAKKVLVIAAVIIVAGGILNYLARKRRG